MNPIAILLLSITTAPAQFVMSWSAMSGGSGGGAAGAFAMQGSIGLTDAASGASGAFAFSGGFWSLLEEAPPPLRMFRNGEDLILAWPHPSPGYVLQASTDMTLWEIVAVPPVLTEGENHVLWGPLADPRRYFRLHRP
jgi:hypothetical protein